jgi:hypothetical protein
MSRQGRILYITITYVTYITFLSLTHNARFLIVYTISTRPCETTWLSYSVDLNISTSSTGSLITAWNLKKYCHTNIQQLVIAVQWPTKQTTRKWFRFMLTKHRCREICGHLFINSRIYLITMNILCPTSTFMSKKKNLMVLVPQQSKYNLWHTNNHYF